MWFERYVEGRGQSAPKRQVDAPATQGRVVSQYEKVEEYGGVGFEAMRRLLRVRKMGFWSRDKDEIARMRIATDVAEGMMLAVGSFTQPKPNERFKTLQVSDSLLGRAMENIDRVKQISLPDRRALHDFVGQTKSDIHRRLRVVGSGVVNGVALQQEKEGFVQALPTTTCLKILIRESRIEGMKYAMLATAAFGCAAVGAAIGVMHESLKDTAEMFVGLMAGGGSHALYIANRELRNARILASVLRNSTDPPHRRTLRHAA